MAGSIIKKLVPRKLILFRRSLIPALRVMMKKNMSRKKLIPILHIHLTDHCNLNCKCCDNFSPLSPEVFADIDVVERDCARISELSNGKVEEIQLLGGEPLLHPKVTMFIETARKYFPTVPINLVSNGLLLLKQQDAFWECCKKNDIQIVVTKYPVKLNFDAIEQHAIQKGVRLHYYGSTGSVLKSMMCSPMDLSGKQDPRDSFLRCNSANRCIALDNGKIYTCSLIPYVKYFNAHFKKNLEVTEKDYLDIYKAKDINEILGFISQPMPFCRYCNKKGTVWDVGFGISKKDISEWADTPET